MDIGNLLVCILLVLATASAQFFPNPKQVRVKKLKAAINSFGFSLFKDLLYTEGEPNVFICPYSLSNLLGMLHFVSANETEKELANVLGYKEVNLTKVQAANTFFAFSTKLLQSSKPKSYTFNSFSTILLNRKKVLLPTFECNEEDFFQIGVADVDFMESGEDLVEAVNHWIATLTNNKILNLIGFVDPSSHMIVVSAAYFEGVWKHKFPLKQSKLGVFYNCGKESLAKEVYMMYMSKDLYLHTNKNLSIVELPFKGRNVSMMILLPSQLDGIDELLHELSYDFLDYVMSWMKKTKTQVVLPRFKIDFNELVTPSLQSLGVKKLFQPLDRVIHKTKISVAENGVEATATEKLLPQTSTFDQTSSLARKHFIVDHPFLFVIYERKLDLVLFMGSVMEL